MLNLFLESLNEGPDTLVAALMSYFECNQLTAVRIMHVMQRGYQHGLDGWYPDGDYSSDADWCYGVGHEIQKLETKVDCEDDVFMLYMEAHEEGLAGRK